MAGVKQMTLQWSLCGSLTDTITTTHNETISFQSHIVELSNCSQLLVVDSIILLLYIFDR